MCTLHKHGDLILDLQLPSQVLQCPPAILALGEGMGVDTGGSLGPWGGGGGADTAVSLGTGGRGGDSNTGGSLGPWGGGGDSNTGGSLEIQPS